MSERQADLRLTKWNDMRRSYAAGAWPLLARTCSPEADVSRMILANTTNPAQRERVKPLFVRQLQGVLHLDAKISDGLLSLVWPNR